VRCPGCGHALVPFRSRLGPSLGPLPRLWRRILRQPSGSLAMPRSEDRWRPAGRPLATARSRRVTFHLYKGTERRRTVVAGNGEKSRSPGRGEVRPCWRVSGPRYDAAVDLVVGAGKLDRTLQDVDALVDSYRTDDGLRYLDYRPLTPPDRLVPEDLAVTISPLGPRLSYSQTSPRLHRAGRRPASASPTSAAEGCGHGPRRTRSKCPTG